MPSGESPLVIVKSQDNGDSGQWGLTPLLFSHVEPVYSQSITVYRGERCVLLLMKGRDPKYSEYIFQKVLKMNLTC